MTDNPNPPLKPILEAALLAAGPLTIEVLQGLFAEAEPPTRPTLRAVLTELQQDCVERGIELIETALGFRFQTKASLTPWLKRLYTERPPRYSRALLETLAIIAYRQPITRQEIETIRGISVSTDIIKKLQDYNWIRLLAHRDTPGHPALYGTTRAFLDHFNLKNLNDLPTLAELRDMENLLQNDLFNLEEEQDHQDMAEEVTTPEDHNVTPTTTVIHLPPQEEVNPALEPFDSQEEDQPLTEKHEALTSADQNTQQTIDVVTIPEDHYVTPITTITDPELEKQRINPPFEEFDYQDQNLKADPKIIVSKDQHIKQTTDISTTEDQYPIQEKLL
jgi:segregation and condensation protein B